MHPASTALPREIHRFSHHSVFGDCWTTFNRTLNRDALGLPNEASLAERLDTLLDMEIRDLRVFWLSLARIAELAVKQAGDYADNCEFQAAGDLLVNPRRIDVYLRGWSSPVVKDRHRGLSQQFAAAIGRDNPVAWLSRKTLPHVREEALLPCMKQTLSASGFMNPAYLADLDRRMGRVADTIAFLMAWPVTDSAQLFRRMRDAGPEGQAFIRSKLCRFDAARFNAMGEDIKNIAMGGGCSAQFLSGSMVQCARNHPAGNTPGTGLRNRPLTDVGRASGQLRPAF
ncbi:hypothetical protein DSCA_49640 [Desulfosarcina alkanivorans]|uniref:Uncharacterized protein n=1 Tax=Desulfosarcina alkanivorans TaxID=571177 RepID=A0A5K7YXL4_9BACT|nr:hypothetical protein [Desulfosarcina alkanivorans]BBO71034.1 hypothetical protein DSCA_49640 [Desulfosarcina alkanivorans]